MLPENLQRFTEPQSVLDHGHVRLIDVMGDDHAIVNAARVSYGEGTKRVSADRHLIRYLVRNSHTSPLEMCEIKLHIKCPIYVFRQWIRHRTASVNEVSGRYSVVTDQAQIASEWRLQSKDNKQGSDGVLDPEVGKYLTARENTHLKDMYDAYQERLEHGVAREQARKDLPLSTYTEAYWKMDLHNLLHFLRLRLDPHAQMEIRVYAEAIAEIVKEWVPWTWEAFEDYKMKGMSLTKFDVQGISHLLRECVYSSTPLTGEKAMQLALEGANLTKKGSGQRPSREAAELRKKLEILLGVIQ